MPLELGVSQIAVWLATVGVIVLIPVALVVFVFRLGQGRASAKPEQVVRSRFARGEMTQDEFDAAMCALGR
jgi:uncharacterized membrane protein